MTKCSSLKKLGFEHPDYQKVTSFINFAKPPKKGSYTPKNTILEFGQKKPPNYIIEQ